MTASPTRVFMTRKQEEAETVQVEWNSLIGQVVSSFGRITDTLVGVEMVEVEFRGRTMFQVIPQLKNFDPLFDA